MSDPSARVARASIDQPPPLTRVRVTARLVPALVLVAWALLLAVWVMGNAPFAAPDETDHFIRAVGVSEGQEIGKADPTARIGVTATQVAWTAQEARLVSLPRGLDPQAFSCELGPGERSAACLNTANLRPPPVTRVTAVGNYQPLPYLLPAVVLRAGSSPPAALRFGRAAEALVALGLLAVAVFALYDAEAPLVSLLGLLLAVTPMALFCAAILSGSATEIAGGVAFFSCLLRVGRPGSVPARWWAFTALSGATLALSRSTSPAWFLLVLLIAVGWSGPKTFARRWAQSRAPRVTAGVLVLAVALNRVWEGLYGTHVSLDTSQLHAGLVGGVHEWWRALPELVGKFGYLEVKLPLIIPLVWFALVLALLAGAGAVSGLRERLALMVVVIVGLVGPVVFFALLIRPTGGGLQGRHVLPLLVAVPLLAGEALYRSRERIRADWLRLLTITIPVAVAVMQATAWYVNAKRYAVGGSGPEWFPGRAAWTPPAGWWTWLAAAALAAVCLGAVALVNRETTNPTAQRGDGALTQGQSLSARA
jgi:Predicted membrane protein (DUF2142)